VSNFANEAKALLELFCFQLNTNCVVHVKFGKDGQLSFTVVDCDVCVCAAWSDE